MRENERTDKADNWRKRREKERNNKQWREQNRNSRQKEEAGQTNQALEGVRYKRETNKENKEPDNTLGGKKKIGGKSENPGKE